MQSKTIISAVGAFGFGSLLGWAITADIYENRIIEEREQLDKTIRNKTQHIWALQDRLEYLSADSDDSIVSVQVDDEPEMPILGQQTLNVFTPQFGSENPITAVETETEDDEDYVVPDGETPEETKTNLQKLIDMYTSDSDARVYSNQTDSNTDDIRSTPPFVISKGDYAWGEEGESYSKITLTYFPRERVLLDDDDEPIEDVARVVGWRNLTQFGGESEDPDVVFVRNHRLETDFEIVKEDAPLPLHVKYGMEKEEFRANKAAGLIKLRQEDE